MEGKTLKQEAITVALKVKGGLDMAKITINLPEENSENGVTLETLEEHVNVRGYRNVEEFINRILADTFGYLPDGKRNKPIPGLQKLFTDYR